MINMTNRNTVRAQYGDSERLNIRILIHDKYSTNRQGFGNWVVSNYPLTGGERVLELGCGTGSMWLGNEDVLARCAQLTLTDLSHGMLADARRNLGSHANVRFDHVDIQSIPYPDESFDLVIANMMLYHVPDVDRALAEVRRVLRRGGALCCSTYGERGITGFMQDVLSAFDVYVDANLAFTLQNGDATLRRHFERVEMRMYDDALAVTDADDLADYMYSCEGMIAMERVDRDRLIALLEQRRRDGIIMVPKEYGMFICHRS